MEFFLCKSEIEIKVIMVLIFWAIRWLYSYLATSDGSISHQELDEDEDEHEHDVNNILPITAIPITKQVAQRQPQAAPFPQVVAANPRLSQPASHPIAHRKASLGSKRKLFRNGLLMHALMQRKG